MNRLLPTIAVLVAFSTPLRAADWPTWRYDAARSAAAPQEIAANPVLLWSRKLPPVRQAWPLEVYQRMNFDASYEPVAMGKLVFLASPNDGSVAACDTETGAEKWKFYTEGPIRCAPAGWQGKLYVGSDDGYLYCLDATSGTVAWKVRGAPAERPDRRQLGNGHLVSFWPVRGGPVVADGAVYFAAGIWPTFGVFLHALDANTGKSKWTSSALGYLSHVRRDHEFYDQDAGFSPQGYLVAVGDRLVVPGGRAMPAGFERATGKLIYYAQGCRRGDSRLAAHGKYAFVGKNAVVRLQDFREAASAWGGRGGNKPEGYPDHAGPPWPPAGLFECPFLSYKYCQGCEAASAGDFSPSFTACDAYSAYAEGVAYSLNNGTFYAHDVANAKIVERDVNWAGKLRIPTWTVPLLWQYKAPPAGRAGGVVIKAGDRLYGHAGKRLIALEKLAGGPLVAWQKDLDGTPSSMIAADSKLFVATAEGGLYCFGQARANPTPKTYDSNAAPLEVKTDGWATKAAEIVNTAGVKSGYCLVLGIKDGRLIEELLSRTDLLILAVDADAEKVSSLRRRFDRAGLLGSRVELFTGPPLEFGFPPYIASLVVSEDAEAARFSEKSDVAKLFNSLRPYGGTLCLDRPAAARLRLDDWAKEAKRANAAVKHGDAWSCLVSAGPLPGSAPWTHEAADAAQTFCCPDDLVKAPLGFLWYGDESGHLLRNHAKDNARPEVCNGRVFGLQQLYKQVVLFAYDAYTGRFLWSRETKCAASNPSHARIAALPDGVYLVVDGKCRVFDPETGESLHTFTFNRIGATVAKDIRVAGDVILVACSEPRPIRGEDFSDYVNSAYTNSKVLVCLDRRTGAELWRRTARSSFCNRGLALWEGLVFCTDAVPISTSEHAKRTAGTRESQSTLYALDARSGGVVWSRPAHYKYSGTVWIGADDWLACAPEYGVLVAGKHNLANAWQAKTGKPLWQNKPIDGQLAIIVQGKTLIDQVGTVYDLFTGQRQGSCGTTRVGCNYMTGSRHLVVQMDDSVSYTDVQERKRYRLRNIRSGCINNIIPADGVLSVPNFCADCICNLPIQTSFAMVYMPESAGWGGKPLPIPTPPVEGPPKKRG
jgi:outer membrane protein assembly factor BamB